MTSQALNPNIALLLGVHNQVPCGSSSDYLLLNAWQLIALRYYMYRRSKWHYFLLDFCYFANVSSLIYFTNDEIAVIFYLSTFNARQLFPFQTFFCFHVRTHTTLVDLD